MEPIFPCLTKQWNGKAMLSDVVHRPECSYSSWKPGQYTSFSGYEKARQGNIHPAGEHCSQDFQGFMEGGASEGLRAASEVLAELKKVWDVRRSPWPVLRSLERNHLSIC
jgi:monoamine oxidase